MALPTARAMNKPKLIMRVSKEWLAGTFLSSALMMLVLIKLLGKHSILSYVFAAIVFLSILGVGAYLHRDDRVFHVLLLWARTSVLKPMYCPFAWKRFGVIREKD